MRWNLDNLYKSFDDPNFDRDFEKLTALIQDMDHFTEKLCRDDPVRTLEQTIDYASRLRKLQSRQMAFANLTQSVQSDHKQAADALVRLRAQFGDLAKINTRLKNYVKELDLEPLFKQSELLQAHRFYLSELKREASHMLSEQEEVLLAKLRNTGSIAFNTLQNDITSNLMIELELEGRKETLPLPAVRNLAYAEDATTRKAGYEAELAAYTRIEKSSAAALNAIKGEVLTVCELIGYKSPLEETVDNSRMDKQTLDALLEAMVDYLPHFRRYLKRKAALLGHKNGLPFYDLFAPIGKSTLSFTYQEAMDYIIKQFSGVSERLSAFVEHAYQNDWLDVEPRPGKRGGAFCSNLHTIGESRVMSNFNGSFSNMSTLAHELGHAYHGFNLKDESILNASYSMPIAETASIFNETLISESALKEASPQEALAILEDSISGSNQVITDIYSRYLFETALFEARKTRTLSPEELKELMLDAQKKAYGDGLDPEVLHPYMWLNKPHYYSAGLSFYNFPYAFGLLFAKGLYAQYKEDPEHFMERYDELLRCTGSMNIYDVAKRVGIDVHDKTFFTRSLETIKQEIDQFIERSEALLAEKE